MEGDLHLTAFHSCEFSGLDCVFSGRQSSPALLKRFQDSHQGFNVNSITKIQSCLKICILGVGRL